MRPTFKEGQKVVIRGLYGLTEDGAATIVREIREGSDKGKWLCTAPDSGYIIVDKGRLTDEEAYWLTKRRE